MHLLKELIGATERRNWAVIMAGGQGLRLRPLTDHVPKPMLKVAGRPILERLVHLLVVFGIRRVFLSINHLGQVIEDHFGDGTEYGCRIEYLREEEPLGTGGSLSLLPESPQHDVLVLNGDLVTQVNIARLLEFHERGAFAATFGVRLYSVNIPFGVVEVDGDDVVRLVEKPTERRLINGGLYVFSPETLKMIPQGEQYPITRLIEQCLDQGLRVGAHLIDEDWIDVGGHDQLRSAQGIT